MSTKDSLGDRMKAYESTSQADLLRRTPVVIRIDGRAFHTFTKRMKHIDQSLERTPYSIKLHEAMMYTTSALVQNVQNCVLGYTQSDEISLVLKDWETHETDSWFGNSVQKMVSISASIATAAFNYYFHEHIEKPNALSDFAQFDSRAYNLPREEVTNYLIWRQQDASRNSVQMFGRFYFSQKQMMGKHNSQVQDMMFEQHGVNWNDQPTWMKRGSCVVRNVVPHGVVGSMPIQCDDEIPIFTQDRQYIEKRLLTVAETEQKATIDEALDSLLLL